MAESDFLVSDNSMMAAESDRIPQVSGGEELSKAIGIPPAEMTPHVRKAIVRLLDELERLRVELSETRSRIEYLERLADQDALAPVANRRAFMRELGRTIAYSSRHKIDSSVLQSFLDQDILPVVPPLGFDADGQTLRVNSDAVAREVATALDAAKVIFVSNDDPRAVSSDRQHQWSGDDAISFIESHPALSVGMASKLRHAARATRDGVPRVHLISSRSEDALLSELFSNEGVGLMVYSDAYQKVRPATRGDIEELYLLIHRAIEDEQLIERSRSDIQGAIEDYIVLEIDGNVVGCVAVHPYSDSGKAELACLYVKKGHTGQGYGSILVGAAIDRAKQLGYENLFALSTQAAGYLERGGFVRSEDLTLLPDERRKKWAKNGRNAVLLTRPLD